MDPIKCNIWSSIIMEKIMKRTIEIKGAEGGTDAKLFAKDLASAYISLASRLG